MRKKSSQFLFILLIVLFNSCNSEEKLIETTQETDRVITLTAAMPPEVIIPRVGLEQKEDKSIVLTWEADDQLQLAYVQKGTKIKKTVSIKNISDDGKKAEFDIILPSDINSESFDLFGVYGGGGLSDTNLTNVILPENAGSARSLEEVKERKDVMLYFELKEIDANNPKASVTFKHLGSLFSISLKNTGLTTINNFTQLRLEGVDGDDNWAFNSGIGGEVFDLETGKFLNSESGINYISFNAKDKNILSGETVNFWSWYPALSDKNWPALVMSVMNNDNEIATTQNSKPARTEPTIAGKSYYFYAEWNGSNLLFTDGPEIEVTDLPHIYIDTDGGVPIIEKKVYLDANIRIDGGGKYEDFEGRTTIRGRGNSTWTMPKKPYRFKLNEKASLLGLPAERNWVLLQNYIDPSLMCNAVAMKTGQLLDMPFTHHIIPVDVTLNGEYIGSYTFTEHKEVTENRINIGEDGWLVEFDTNFDEDYQFLSNNFKLPVMLQYPELDDMAESDANIIFNEIKNDFNALEELIYSESFPNNNYLESFDANAFVDYLIVYMLTDNEEINHPKSTYIHKKKGGKYSMGPIWDFDWAFGFEGGTHFTEPTRSLFWTGAKASSGTAFFTKIIKDPTIKDIFRTEWANFKIEKYPILIEYIRDYAETIRESHARDQVRWGQSSGDIDVYSTKLLDWLSQRVEYMDSMASDGL